MNLANNCRMTLAISLAILLLWANKSVAFPSKMKPGHSSRHAYRKTSLINDSFLISEDVPSRGRMLSLPKVESNTLPSRLPSKLPSNERIWNKAKSTFRRLDTSEDKFDLHKLSSLVYLAATIHILYQKQSPRSTRDSSRWSSWNSRADHNPCRCGFHDCPVRART